MKRNDRARRVAVHRLIVDNSEVIEPGVIEIHNGKVTDYYELTGEQPSTEWLGGVVFIKNDDTNWPRAYRDGKLIE